MSGFEQQASGAVLDLMQDEEEDMKRMRGIKKWYGICWRVGCRRAYTNNVGVLFIGIASVNVLWVEGQRQTKRRK